MNLFILEMYSYGYYTKEQMQLFVKVGYISQEEYNNNVN